MGVFAYYSPIGLGLLLTLILNTVIRERLPSGVSETSFWLIVIATGLVVGLGAQLLLIGAQGVVAQVMPVPFGRSIRGRPAVAIGSFLLMAVVLLMTAALLYADTRESALVMGGIAGAGGLTALGIYAWNWPTAARDFAESPR